MPTPKFRYNVKTLRFERVKISILRIMTGILSYLTFGVFFFVGLVYLQDYLIDTPLEKSLREENKALVNHKILLTAQLSQSNQQLQELKNQDVAIYQKLFETSLAEPSDPSVEREQILLAQASDFNRLSEELGKRFSQLNAHARAGNEFYKENASIDRSDVSLITSVPSMAPLDNFDVPRLVSGFGTRINPFHKGHYHHDGVDIAAPKGTPVLAAGPGTVILVKKSELLAGYGNYIEINHGNGYITRYSHVEEIATRYGKQVKKGEVIGTVGSTGGSIAPHLHYEVIKDNKNVDPITYMVEGLTPNQYEVLLNQSKKQNQSLD